MQKLFLMCEFDLDSSDPAADEVVARLEKALATPNLKEAVRLYFEHGSSFAAQTFDSLGCNNPDRITPDDLLAVTLLDVSWKPRAVRAMLVEQADQVNGLLSAIDGNTTLWDGERGCQELLKADRLWRIIKGLDGVGPTKTSKLLARKRPQLVPITDRIIVAAIGSGHNWWCTLRHCFKQESLRDAVERLRPQEQECVSLLRAFDVAIWILCSKSRDARKARTAAGVAQDSCHCKLPGKWTFRRGRGLALPDA